VISTSNRGLLLFVLILSGIIWLAVSSVTANAVHVFAKSSFSLLPFGSVSIGLLTVAVIWSLSVVYLITVTSFIPKKSAVLSACTIIAWVITLLVFTALEDEFLREAGAAAVFVWMLEIAVAFMLVHRANGPPLPNPHVQDGLVLAIIALAWITLTKSILLCVFPGVDIR
jgi:hypothetical protein